MTLRLFILTSSHLSFAKAHLEWSKNTIMAFLFDSIDMHWATITRLQKRRSSLHRPRIPVRKSGTDSTDSCSLKFSLIARKDGVCWKSSLLDFKNLLAPEIVSYRVVSYCIALHCMASYHSLASKSHSAAWPDRQLLLVSCRLWSLPEKLNCHS